MSETERMPSDALRDGIRRIHEWYSLLTDEQRTNCRGVSVTFDPDGLGVGVTLLPWWDDQDGNDVARAAGTGTERRATEK